MKYYRYISETQVEEYDKKYVVVDEKQISHPSAETLLKAGIKPLVEGPMPEYDENTQYLERYYEDGETEITRQYRVCDYPEEVIDDEVADA